MTGGFVRLTKQSKHQNDKGTIPLVNSECLATLTGEARLFFTYLKQTFRPCQTLLKVVLRRKAS